MVAFIAADFSKVSRLLSDQEYAWSMNFGDCTISDGVLQVDYRGDYPEFTSDQIETIKAEGFERADTFWYEITPPPHDAESRQALLNIFNKRPSSTLVPETARPSLQVSFVTALSDEQVASIQKIGMRAEAIPTVPLRIAL